MENFFIAFLLFLFIWLLLATTVFNKVSSYQKRDKRKRFIKGRIYYYKVGDKKFTFLFVRVIFLVSLFLFLLLGLLLLTY